MQWPQLIMATILAIGLLIPIFNIGNKSGNERVTSLVAISLNVALLTWGGFWT